MLKKIWIGTSIFPKQKSLTILISPRFIPKGTKPSYRELGPGNLPVVESGKKKIHFTDTYHCGDAHQSFWSDHRIRGQIDMLKVMGGGSRKGFYFFFLGGPPQDHPELFSMEVWEGLL